MNNTGLEYFSAWVRIWRESRGWVAQVLILPDERPYYFDTPEKLLHFLEQVVRRSGETPPDSHP